MESNSNRPDLHTLLSSQVNKMPPNSIWCSSLPSVLNRSISHFEISVNKIIRTKLPSGHTLDERLNELNEMVVTHGDNPDIQKYILNKIRFMDLEMTNEGYQRLHALAESYFVSK